MPFEAVHPVGQPFPCPWSWQSRLLARAQEQADGHYRLSFLSRVDIEARAGPPSVWLRS